MFYVTRGQDGVGMGLGGGWGGGGGGGGGGRQGVTWRVSSGSWEGAGFGVGRRFLVCSDVPRTCGSRPWLRVRKYPPSLRMREGWRGGRGSGTRKRRRGRARVLPEGGSGPEERGGGGGGGGEGWREGMNDLPT